MLHKTSPLEHERSGDRISYQIVLPVLEVLQFRAPTYPYGKPGLLFAYQEVLGGPCNAPTYITDAYHNLLILHLSGMPVPLSPVDIVHGVLLHSVSTELDSKPVMNLSRQPVWQQVLFPGSFETCSNARQGKGNYRCS